LAPKTAFVLALADNPDGNPPLEHWPPFRPIPLARQSSMQWGPIRQVVASDTQAPRRYLVIAPMKDGKAGTPVQLQQP
jgi:hypothetical protein